jgi:hypothetical protein
MADKSIQITDNSEIRIVEDSHIKIDEGSVIETRGTPEHPFHIQDVQNIAPIAAHIKEVNHIDPINVESLFVSQVRNIDPIHVERFNVTNLPLVNMTLRQLPPVELNVGRLPAVSIGTHQVFEIPSFYTLRARFLGLEVLRVQLAGSTRVAPMDRFRREQQRASSRSFPVVATAGNPAIPSFFTSKGGRDKAGQEHSSVSVSGFGPAAAGGTSLSGGG